MCVEWTLLLTTYVQLPSTDHYHAVPTSTNTTGMLQVHKDTTPKLSHPLPLRGSGAGVTPRSTNAAPLDGASRQRTSQHLPSMRSQTGQDGGRQAAMTQLVGIPSSHVHSMHGVSLEGTYMSPSSTKSPLQSTQRNPLATR